MKPGLRLLSVGPLHELELGRDTLAPLEQAPVSAKGKHSTLGLWGQLERMIVGCLKVWRVRGCRMLGSQTRGSLSLGTARSHSSPGGQPSLSVLDSSHGSPCGPPASARKRMVSVEGGGFNVSGLK